MQRFEHPRALGIAALIGSILILSTGCGYRSQLSGSSAAVDRSGRESLSNSTRVAMLALRNDSPEPWLDRIVTDAMRREITARANFDFVNDPDRADLVLRGRIRPATTISKSFSSFVAALEYGLTLQLDLEILFSNGSVLRLDPKVLSASDVYLASADVEVTRTNRLEVLRHLSDLLASRVADSIELIRHPIPTRRVEEGG